MLGLICWQTLHMMSNLQLYFASTVVGRPCIRSGGKTLVVAVMDGGGCGLDGILAGHLADRYD